MDANELARYPRTEHLEDSRLGPGDDAKGRIKLASLQGCWLVIEEKVDAANSGISFAGGELLLQSRGHFLTGGVRERQFSRLKSWADAHRDALYAALGERYVMYGETMSAKHTMFYDKLPHLFMEFDVFDKTSQRFLNTQQRQVLLAESPVVQVPVLWEGYAPRRMADIKCLVKASLCRSPQWRNAFGLACERAGVDVVRAVSETDMSDLIEGLYIKVETQEGTVDRYKWVRSGFVQAIEESGTHWAERPLVANGLDPLVDLNSPTICWETPGIFGRDATGAYKRWASNPPDDSAVPSLPRRRRP